MNCFAPDKTHISLMYSCIKECKWNVVLLVLNVLELNVCAVGIHQVLWPDYLYEYNGNCWAPLHPLCSCAAFKYSCLSGLLSMWSIWRKRNNLIFTRFDLFLIELKSFLLFFSWYLSMVWWLLLASLLLFFVESLIYTKSLFLIFLIIYPPKKVFVDLHIYH